MYELRFDEEGAKPMFYQKTHLSNLLILLPTITFAGTLDSPAPPGEPASAMYPMSDICQRLETGAPGTKQAFIEVTSAPSPSNCTLNDVMDKAPAKDNNNGVQPHKVPAGKTYWGLTDGNWGLQTGTMPTHSAVTIIPISTNQPIAAGYHNGSGIVEGSHNLRPENIRTGVTIFGVTGTFSGTTTSTPSQSSSSNRYTDNGNGTVTDNWTGLIWLKNANCFGTKTWENAMRAAANLVNGQCSLSDGSTRGTWRLPTKEEWEVMIDLRYERPALSNAAATEQWTEGDTFSSVKSGNYWSATMYPGNVNLIWDVSFLKGDLGTSNKGYDRYVWPVRDKQ